MRTSGHFRFGWSFGAPQARELAPGSVVNLGIGLPTLVLELRP